MLVLSRKIGEEIRLVEAGVTIRLMGTKPSRAQIAIDAPRDLTVLRGELQTDASGTIEERTTSSALARLSAWVDSVASDELVEHLPLIDDLVARLLELQLAVKQSEDPPPIAISYDDLAPTAIVREAPMGYVVPGCC